MSGNQSANYPWNNESWDLYSKNNSPFIQPTQFIFMPAHAHLLKALDTIGNCQRRVSSLGVTQHMHKITNLWTFEFNIGRQSCQIKKHRLVTRICALSVGTSNSKSKVSKSSSWKVTSFLKNTLLQREPFLTMFYTNSSPFLVTEVGFYVNNYSE